MKHLLPTIALFSLFCLNAQHQTNVDFTRCKARIEPMPSEKAISGRIAYEFNVLKDIDSLFLDAKNMTFSAVTLNDTLVDYSYDGKRISIFKKFQKGDSDTLRCTYKVRPKQAVYFSGWNDSIEGNEQIWTQGQGKYTSHWLPSFDDMEEKVAFDITINAAAPLQVIANGKLTEKAFRNSETLDWSFDMQKPMSSYLLAFVIGNYKKQELTSQSGIPIKNYYYEQDSLRVESTYRYTKEIFDFLEKEIGFPYPWQNYKQIPVHDFLYAGMENTTATIFSDGYVIDSTAFIDKNYVNVNAHELAHQWFGNLVTEKDGNHHWLHEGFATYYAQLVEKEIFGEDHYYWKLYNSFIQLKNGIDRGEGQNLIDPKASSLIFYEKGAWALFMLRNQIGDKAFTKGMLSYLEKYQFKNVTVADFLKEMESASKVDLSGFRKEWLESTGIPLEKAKKQLRTNSRSLDRLFTIVEEQQKSQSNAIGYLNHWNASNSIHLKKYLLANYYAFLPEEIYAKAFESDTVPIRQALLLGRDLPKFLDQEKLESFLEDDSYVTKENILFRLWQNFPQDRPKYLDATKDIVGLPNKNLRIVWLTLAMLSDNYKGRKTKDYFDELSSYTSPKYNFEIRQGAFFYLKEAFGLNTESLISLVKASNHHSWQFKKFARDLLKELLKDFDYKTRLKKLATEIDTKELRYLKTELNKE